MNPKDVTVVPWNDRPGHTNESFCDRVINMCMGV